MAFEQWTNWQSDNFWPFKYQTDYSEIQIPTVVSVFESFLSKFSQIKNKDKIRSHVWINNKTGLQPVSIPEQQILGFFQKGFKKGSFSKSFKTAQKWCKRCLWRTKPVSKQNWSNLAWFMSRITFQTSSSICYALKGKLPTGSFLHFRVSFRGGEQNRRTDFDKPFYIRTVFHR